VTAGVMAALAWADHGAGVAPSGSGWGLGWLFAVGLVVVVVLAAWAMFAPVADEPDDQDAGSAPDAAPRRRGSMK
jgi:hypothetical protein